MSIMTKIADSAGVSTEVVISGISKLSKSAETVWLIKMPPKTVPKMIELTVKPSIQPLAATNFSGGSSSVKIPYLAGE